MKRVIIATIKLLLLSACPIAALALDVTNIITHQGGGFYYPAKVCGPAPTNGQTQGYMPANVWTLLSSDNAGQPCKAGPNDAFCDRNSNWNYTIHGHLTLQRPTGGTNATSVEVRTYIAPPGPPEFSCTPGGSTLNCTGPGVLAEDSTYAVGSATESIPFDLGWFQLAATDSLGGANYHSFYVFVIPNGGPLQCIVNDYITTEHN